VQKALDYGDRLRLYFNIVCYSLTFHKGQTAMTAETVNGRTLKQWMAEVDTIIGRRFGISVHDLADTTFWDMWHD